MNLLKLSEFVDLGVSYLNFSEFVICSCRTVGAQTKQLYVFGKGMLDTLYDVFWMLPFSSKKQAQIIRQENQITDEEWENVAN